MDIGWGGLPIMFPSKTAMNYLWHETNIIPEEEIAQGSHYRARQAMLDNVRPSNIDYKIQEAMESSAFPDIIKIK